jgi:saccharopine dehydrogenase-like NADP-dependent oxidoreductase
MKFIVLGGAGDMGSRAVEDLAQTPGVELVTIADLDTARAAQLAATLRRGPARVDVKRIDANDVSSLVTALRGYDVAASALGPFHRFEPILVEAAIAAGVDYASVCDEWGPAEQVLHAFGQKAREAGRVVLIGLGASPGTTNVAFRYLADQMDVVKRANIYCYQPLDAGGGLAVLKHMLHIMSGEVAVWRKGGPLRLPALSEERSIEFPLFGSINVWNMGHAEPVTIPLFFPTIDEVNFYMGFGAGAELLVTPARWGLFSTSMSIDIAANLLAVADRVTRRDAPSHGAIRVDVVGEIGGQKVHRILCGTGQMREVTGMSLSIGARMVALKQLTVEGGGVFAPEACLDPAEFMRAFAEKGLYIYEDVNMTKPAQP